MKFIIGSMLSNLTFLRVHSQSVFTATRERFRILSKDSHWMMSAFLAHQGFCVFSLNYGLAPKYRFPEGLGGGMQLWEWVMTMHLECGGALNNFLSLVNLRALILVVASPLLIV